MCPPPHTGYETVAHNTELFFFWILLLILCVLLLIQATKLSRNFGFVKFEARESAQEAVHELNNADVQGRKLLVPHEIPHHAH